MSGNNHLSDHNLKSRSDQSEQLLKELWDEYDALNKLFEGKCFQALTNRLKNENKILLKEIEEKKKELINVEQKHKVPQILNGTRSAQPVTKEIVCSTDSTKASSEPVVEDVKEKSKPKKKSDKQSKPASQPASQAAPVDVSRLDFRVGHIISAKKHPDADSLYVEDVDLGDGKIRTVVSGLVKSVPLDQMQNRMAVLLCNLKPSKMRGVTSEAMVMCGVTPEKTEILDPPKGAVPGDLVEFEGYTRNPDAVLSSKHKVFETVQPDLKVDGQGIATYKGIQWTVIGKGPVRAPSVKNAIIK